jgi:hypothetical protein
VKEKGKEIEQIFYLASSFRCGFVHCCNHSLKLIVVRNVCNVCEYNYLQWHSAAVGRKVSQNSVMAAAAARPPKIYPRLN